MSFSEAGLEATLNRLLPKKLKELGQFYSVDELATKEEIKELIAAMNQRLEAVDKRFELLIAEISMISAGIGTLGGDSGSAQRNT